MIHLHEVRDQDTHYKINPITMEIEDNGSGKNELNLGDHNSEIYTFEIPRVVEGHDMTLCNLVEIHFINIGTTDKSKDIHRVKDMAPAEDDPDTLVFSWPVSGAATMYSGSLNYRIKFACLDENGNYTYRKWTDVYKGITVGDGFDNGEAVEQQYSDVLSQWEARLDALEQNAGGMATLVVTLDREQGKVSHTAGQILEHINAGGAVTLAYEHTEGDFIYCPLAHCLEGSARFVIEHDDGAHEFIEIAYDGTFWIDLRQLASSEDLKDVAPYIIKLQSIFVDNEPAYQIESFNWNILAAQIKNNRSVVLKHESGGNYTFYGLASAQIAELSGNGQFVLFQSCTSDSGQYINGYKIYSDGTVENIQYPVTPDESLSIPGRAADAFEVGNRINTLDEKLNSCTSLLIVELSAHDENGERYSLRHPAEMLEHISAGGSVVLYADGLYFNMLSCTSYDACFGITKWQKVRDESGETEPYWVANNSGWIIDETTIATPYNHQLSSGSEKLNNLTPILIVELKTESDSRASHTAVEIFAHVSAGGLVMMYDFNRATYYNMLGCTPDRASFGNTELVEIIAENGEITPYWTVKSDKWIIDEDGRASWHGHQLSSGNEKLGDIATALDTIIAMQNELIGGGTT